MSQRLKDTHEGEDYMVKCAVGEEVPKPLGSGLVRGGLHPVLGHCIVLRKSCWWNSGYWKDLL